jgi:integrase
MVHTFARVGAALQMRVEDVYVQGRRNWVRLHEEGGKEHEMPCHHNLDEYLHAYLEQDALQDDRKGWLFRSVKGRSGWIRKAVTASELPMHERAKLAGATTHWLRHTFGTRAIARDGPLKVIQARMGHASIQTTTAIYGRAPIKRRVDELGKASS